MPISELNQRIKVTYELRMDSNEQTIGDEISFMVMADSDVVEMQNFNYEGNLLADENQDHIGMSKQSVKQRK